MLEESKSKRVCILWNVKTLCMRYLFIVLSLLGNYYYCLWSLKNFWPLHIFHEFTDVLILPVYRERNIKSSTVEKHRRWPRTREMCSLLRSVLFACCFLGWHLRSTSKAFYHHSIFFFFWWHYLIIQSLLGENVSWFSALLRTWTKKIV